MSIKGLIDSAELHMERRRFARGVSRSELEAAPESERRALGELRGAANEARVLRALKAATLPNWIIAIRPGTTGEDHKGGDIVVTATDAGRLYLQVKSSAAGARLFREIGAAKGKEGKIAVVVVADGASDEAVARLALIELRLLRRRRIEEGRR